MKTKISNFIKNINKNKLKKSFLISFIFLSILVIISSIGFTYARYETDATLNLKPNIAFFIVNTTTEKQSLELARMVPSNDYYDYYFEVSNFLDNKKSNVDLKYTISLTMTTNLPLEYQIYRVDDNSLSNIKMVDVITNEDGMYFKKYTDSNEYFLSHESKKTDRYLLRVNFPIEYKNNPDYYESVIDLVEVTIDATQVV